MEPTDTRMKTYSSYWHLSDGQRRFHWADLVDSLLVCMLLVLTFPWKVILVFPANVEGNEEASGDAESSS